jgi:hypothetical protein
MRHHLRLVTTLAFALVAYGVLVVALRWISQPSDRSLYSGIALLFALLVVVPVAFQQIWRNL